MIKSNEKIKYLEKEAFRLVELLQSLPHDKNGDIEIKGSSKERGIVDLQTVVGPVVFHSEVDDVTYFIKECEKGECVGFNFEACKDFEKFVSTIYKDKSINNLVSKSFIKDMTFKWLVTTYRNKKANTGFISHLEEQIASSIKEIKVFFPLLNIDVNIPFEIGKVSIEFFTKEHFDSFENEFRKEFPDREDNPYEDLRKKFQGGVFATCKVKAERKKAKEIAFEKCLLAVDVLKICDRTLDRPNEKTTYDIDRRVIGKPFNHTITQDSDTPNHIRIDMVNNPNFHSFSEKSLKTLFEERYLGVFHDFLNNIDDREITELENLLTNAIRSFANSISNNDQHKRIVEIFSILESLLLKNEDSGIIDSVTKYCSKLVFKKVEHRLDLINLLKEMYKIRSSMIHHAKRREFSLENLRKLQFVTFSLIKELIKKTQHHKTKISLLDEIDLEVLKAY